MANYQTTASVELSINGKQARQYLKSLENNADELRKKLEAATKAGDKASMKKFQKELNDTKRLIEQIQGSTKTAEQVLRNLDNVSPRELKKTLRQLERQLNNIERGSAAWDAQTARIRRVRAQIASVNAELREHETLMGRVKRFLGDGMAGAIGGLATAGGLIAGAKSAVESYASVQEEMAGVSKYSGLAADEVKRLNEEFAKMDTRTSIEDLNRLAQDAGRLGKTKPEDILGFVRAADKVNVALDDLGEGATLTLSKLTDIFGEEKRLGTERALLSVGSVINELSQSCSASAPYIAEFASRMGGVGKAAGMSIQDIMAFGAVLDSQGMNVEAASTALQQLTVRIMREPAKYAETAGLSVKKFTEMVKTDMTGALMVLFETLQKKGGMDVLAPLFADMGEKGANSVKVLSTLSGKIDDVKIRLSEANAAYAEATSIGKEFDTANSTVAASLEKSQKKIRETVTALGEQLYPVMLDVSNVGGKIAEGLRLPLSVLIQLRGVLIPLIVTLGGYYAALGVAKAATVAWAVTTKAATAIAAPFRAAVGLCRVAMLAMTEGIGAARLGMAALSKTMTAMPWGAIIAAVAAVGTAIYNLCNRTNEYTDSLRKATDAAEGTTEAAMREKRQLDELFGVLQTAKKGTEAYNNAKNTLIKNYGVYLKGLINERGEITNLKAAYDRLNVAIQRSNTLRAIQEARTTTENAHTQKQSELLSELSKSLDTYGVNAKKKGEIMAKATQEVMNTGKLSIRLYREIQELTNTKSGFGNSFKNAGKSLFSETKLPWRIAAQINEDARDYERGRKSLNEMETATNKRGKFGNKSAEELLQLLEKAKGDQKTEIEIELSIRGINLPTPQEPATPTAGNSTYTGVSSSGESKAEKAKREKEERQREEEQRKREELRVKTAELQREQRAEEMQTELDFYDKKSEIYGDEEKKLITLHQIRVKYLKQLRDLYEEDSEEYKSYQGKIQEEQGAENLRISKKWEEKLAQFKNSYGKLTAKERYAEELNLLNTLYEKKLIKEEEYQKALAELKKKYADETLPESSKPQKSEAAADRDAEAVDMKKLEEWYEANPDATEEYEKKKDNIREYYNKKALARAKGMGSDYATMLINVYEAFQKMFSDTEEDGENWAGKLAKVMGAVFALMNAGMAAFSEYSEACTELEIARTEKRYDAEIKAAEGNTYKTAKLEEEKEKKVAKIKNKAAQQAFTIQVIQAVAQTATNALTAYGSALAVPVVGTILAPIAAAMAVAAGMVQIATIKKQKEAAAAKGYSEGGFTRPGGKDEPAGIVHAGEWVASQKLVNNPRVRPIINMLEQAQRTNTIGSLMANDVSMAITAPARLAAAQAGETKTVIIREPAPDTRQLKALGELGGVINTLNDRLSSPIEARTYITGEHGINEQRDRYQRMLRNKAPKTRKSSI